MSPSHPNARHLVVYAVLAVLYATISVEAACPATCHQFAECVDNTRCECIPGFRGDGVNSCELDPCVAASGCSDCLSRTGCSFCGAGEHGVCASEDSPLLSECSDAGGSIIAEAQQCPTLPATTCGSINALSCDLCHAAAHCTTCLDPVTNLRTCVPRDGSEFHCPTNSTLETSCPATPTCTSSSDCTSGHACVFGTCQCIIAPEGTECVPVTTTCGSNVCGSHEYCDEETSTCSCVLPYERVDGECQYLSKLTSNSATFQPAQLSLYEQSAHIVNTIETLVVTVPDFEQVSISFPDFENLEPGIASVTVYDGDNTNAPVVAKIDASSTTTSGLVTTGPVATLTFRSTRKGYQRNVDGGASTTDTDTFRANIQGINPSPDASPCLERILTPAWPPVGSTTAEPFYITSLPDEADTSSDSACVRWVFDPVINTTLITAEAYQVVVNLFIPRSDTSSLSILSGVTGGDSPVLSLGTLSKLSQGVSYFSSQPPTLELRGNMTSSVSITLTVTEPNQTPPRPNGAICSTLSDPLIVDDGKIKFVPPSAGFSDNCFEWPVSTTKFADYSVNFTALNFPDGAELRIYPNGDTSATPFLINSDTITTQKSIVYTSPGASDLLVLVYHNIDEADFSVVPFRAVFQSGSPKPWPRVACDHTETIELIPGTDVAHVKQDAFYPENFCGQYTLSLDPEIYSHIKVEVISYGMPDGLDILAFYNDTNVLDTSSVNRIALITGLGNSDVNKSDIDPLLEVPRPAPILPIFRSSGPVITAVFTSNGARTGLGYNFYLVGIKRPIDTECSDPEPVVVTSDGLGNVTTESIAVTSYRPGQCKQWLVTSSDNAFPIVKFSLLSIDLELTSDRILLYDGAERVDRQLITILASGTRLPNVTTFYSRKPSMLVVFEADTNVQKTGFTADVTALASDPGGSALVCTGDQVILDGVIGEIRTPAPYTAESCIEYVVRPARPTAVVESIRFVTTRAELEGPDTVQIFDGSDPAVPFSVNAEFNDTDVPVLNTFKGTNPDAVGTVTVTTKPESLVLFRSVAQTVSRLGFRATYFGVDSTGCVSDRIVASSGTFQSADGVRPFPTSFCQRWLLQPSGLNYVTFNGFSDFVIPDSKDTVTIYDGATTDSPVLATYRGREDVYLNHTLQSSGSSMLIEFLSDDTIEGTGFTFSFDGTNTKLVKRQLRNGVFCARRIDAKFSPINIFAEVARTEETATFGSQPTPYLPDSCQEWVFNPTDFKRVRVEFKRFDLEDGVDFVTIFAGDTQEAEVVARYTGKSVPRSVLVDKPMMVVFESDNAFNGNGFVAVHEGINGPVIDRGVTPTSVNPLEDVTTPVKEIFIIGSDEEPQPVRIRLTVQHGNLAVTRGDGTVVQGKVVDIAGIVSELNGALATLTYTGNKHYCGAEQGSESMEVKLGYDVSSVLETTDELDPIPFTISCVNDAPEILVVDTLPVLVEDTFTSVPVFTFFDVDALSLNAGELCRQTECSEDVWTQTFTPDVQVTITASSGRIESVTLFDDITVVDSTASNIVLRGSIPSLNAALHALHILAPLNSCGSSATIQLSLEISDLSHGGDGGVQTATASVPLNVTCVDDAPVLTLAKTVITMDEDASDVLVKAVAVSDIDGSATGYQVDLSVTVGALSASQVVGASITELMTALDAVTFTPPSDYCNTYGGASLHDSISVRLQSGDHTSEATIPIDIACQNDAPVITQPTQGNYTQGGSGSLSVLVNDIDSNFVRATVSSATFVFDLALGITVRQGVIHLDQDTNQVIAFGTLSQVNELLALVTLRARWEVTGETDEATVVVEDGALTSDGSSARRVTFTTRAVVIPRVSEPLIKIVGDGGDLTPVSGLHTVEETSIEIDVSIDVEDPTETVVITIAGNDLKSATGAGVTKTGDVWSLGARHGVLSLLTKDAYCGTTSIVVTATTTEPSTGAKRDASVTLPFEVDCIARDPTLTVALAEVTITEDGDAALGISAQVQHPDHETLKVLVRGIPDGVTFTPGVTVDNGVAILDNSKLATYRVVPVSHDARDFELEIIAEAHVNSPPGVASVAKTLKVVVTAVADPVLISGPAQVEGAEDQPVSIPLQVTSVDTDGSESLTSVTIKDVPVLATITPGSRATNGDWNVPIDQLNALTITATRGVSFDIRVVASITDRDQDDQPPLAHPSVSTASKTVRVVVNGVADPPRVFLPTTIHVPLHSINHNKNDDFFKFPVGSGLGLAAATSGDNDNDNDDDDDDSNKWRKLIDNKSLQFHEKYYGAWIYGHDDDSDDSHTSYKRGTTSLFHLRDGHHKDSACHRAQFPTFKDTCGCDFIPTPRPGNSGSKSKSKGGSKRLRVLSKSKPGSKRDKKDFPCEKKIYKTECMFIRVKLPIVITAAEAGETLDSTVTVTLRGASPCVRLSVGTPVAGSTDPSWTVATSDLADLEMHVPDQYAYSEITLIVAASATEGSSSASQEFTSTVIFNNDDLGTFNSIADVPLSSVSLTSSVDLAFNAPRIGYVQGTEVVTVSLSGVPEGFYLQTYNNLIAGGGSDPIVLDFFTLTQPMSLRAPTGFTSEYDGAVILSAVVTSKRVSDDKVQTQTRSIRIEIFADPDRPSPSHTAALVADLARGPLSKTDCFCDRKTDDDDHDDHDDHHDHEDDHDDDDHHHHRFGKYKRKFSYTHYHYHDDTGTCKYSPETTLPILSLGASSSAIRIDGVRPCDYLSEAVRGTNAVWTLEAGVSHPRLTAMQESGPFVLTTTSSDGSRIHDITRRSTVVVPRNDLHGIMDPAYTLARLTVDEDKSVGLAVHTTPALQSDLVQSGVLQSVNVFNLPAGSHLKFQGQTLTPDEAGRVSIFGPFDDVASTLSGVEFFPPTDSSKDVTLIIQNIFNATIPEVIGDDNDDDDDDSTPPTSEILFAVFITTEIDVRPVLDIELPEQVTTREDTEVSLGLKLSALDVEQKNTYARDATLSIAGVPNGATLSAGSAEADAWVIDVKDLECTAAGVCALSFTPATNFHGEVTLVITSGTRSVQDDTTTVKVIVGGVCDIPTVSTENAHGSEDQDIGLSIQAALTDTDGSETLSVVISGVPLAGALSHGNVVQTSGGFKSVQVSPSDLSDLKYIPATHKDDTVELTVVVTSTEGSAVQQSDRACSASSSFTVTVTGVADTPTLVVTAPESVGEDNPFDISFVASTPDSDGSEALRLSVTLDQAHARLVGLDADAAGNYIVPVATTSAFTIVPPLHFSGTLQVTLALSSVESRGRDSATTTVVQTITITPLSEKPSLTAYNSAGNEDECIPLLLLARTVDRDGSESIAVAVSDIPTGFTIPGVTITDGRATIDRNAIATTCIVPAKDVSGDFTLTFVATTTDASSTSTQRDSVAFVLTVESVADQPTLTITSAALSTAEDQPVALGLAASLADKDGSEVLQGVIVQGVPAGGKIVPGTNLGDADGQWQVAVSDLAQAQLVPPADATGVLFLQASVVSEESAVPLTAGRSSSSLAFAVTISPVIDEASVSTASPVGVAASDRTFTLSFAPRFASGTTSAPVLLSGVPAGATVSFAGALPLGPSSGLTGTYALDPAQLVAANGQVSIALSKDEDVRTSPFTLTVTAVATEPETDAFSVYTDTIIVDPSKAPAPQLQPTTNSIHFSEDGSFSVSSLFNEPPVSGSLTAVANVAPESLLWLTGATTAEQSISASWSDLLTYNPRTALHESINSGILSIQVTDSSSGTTSAATFAISASPVPDTPTIDAPVNVEQIEDRPVRVPVRGALQDTDGSEYLEFTISGLPTGATLSPAGTVRDGQLFFTPSEILELEVTPPSHTNSGYTLTITAIATERATGETATAVARIYFTVQGVADPPIASAQGSTGREDTAIPLHIEASTIDSDENLSIRIEGVPSTATLSAGTRSTDGSSWTLAIADLTGLTLTPPRYYSGLIHLDVTFTTTEGSDSASSTLRLPVTVKPVANSPLITTPSSFTTQEDTTADIAVTVSSPDTDGSETVSAVVTVSQDCGFIGNLQSGPNPGEYLVPDTSLLTALRFSPARNSHGPCNVKIDATSHDGPSTAGASATFTVNTLAVADAPVISSDPSILATDLLEDGSWALTSDLGLGVSLADADGSETLAICFTVTPADAMTFAVAGTVDNCFPSLNGVVATPKAQYSGAVQVNIVATATETGEDHEVAVRSAESSLQLDLVIAPVADAPVFTGCTDVEGVEDQAILIPVGVNTADSDGSETITLKLAFSEAVTCTNCASTSDDMTITAATISQSGGILIQAPLHFTGQISLKIDASVRDESATPERENTGPTVTDACTITITVTNVNDAPQALRTIVALPRDHQSIITLKASDVDAQTTLRYVINSLPEFATLHEVTSLADGRVSTRTTALRVGDTISSPRVAYRMRISSREALREKYDRTSSKSFSEPHETVIAVDSFTFAVSDGSIVSEPAAVDLAIFRYHLTNVQSHCDTNVPGFGGCDCFENYQPSSGTTSTIRCCQGWTGHEQSGPLIVDYKPCLQRQTYDIHAGTASTPWYTVAPSTSTTLDNIVTLMINVEATVETGAPAAEGVITVETTSDADLQLRSASVDNDLVQDASLLSLIQPVSPVVDISVADESAPLTAPATICFPYGLLRLTKKQREERKLCLGYINKNKVWVCESKLEFNVKCHKDGPVGVRGSTTHFTPFAVLPTEETPATVTASGLDHGEPELVAITAGNDGVGQGEDTGGLNNAVYWAPVLAIACVAILIAAAVPMYRRYRASQSAVLPSPVEADLDGSTGSLPDPAKHALPPLSAKSSTGSMSPLPQLRVDGEWSSREVSVPPSPGSDLFVRSLKDRPAPPPPPSENNGADGKSPVPVGKKLLPQLDIFRRIKSLERPPAPPPPPMSPSADRSSTPSPLPKLVPKNATDSAPLPPIVVPKETSE